MFLIDTDHLGILQHGASPEFGRLRERLASHLSTAFYVSIVSFHEQCQGWNAYISRARDQRGVVHGYSMFQRVLADFSVAQVVPFNAAAASTFEALRGQKVRVPTIDLRIASIALSRDLILLSRNLRDFGKVPGLRVQDWTS
jgi:tRNA(fMet)-specific endonuclease VapC